VILQNDSNMRFAVRLAYNGYNYSGWQSQDNARTVQGEIEAILFKKFRQKISVLGCGRTDKGVHASDFVMHFDCDEDISDGFIYHFNKMLPKDISFYSINKVDKDFHARFDAISRSYVYKINTIKNPFKPELSYYFPMIENVNFEAMQNAANILLKYEEFFPFCKTNTDVKTMICHLSQSRWEKNKKTGEYFFHITSNRFLRGMVRLIVGMTINVGLGKMSLDELENALKMQKRLEMDWSVPAHGLYLNKIIYP